MDKILSCCFTGYRPEKFRFEFSRENREYNDFENRLTCAIADIADRGYKIFYSGVARGFDLVAAETVLLLKQSGREISLNCVVPYKGQSAAWSTDWRRRYLNVLKSADEITVLSEEYFKGCFARRNRYMVERSDAVITYFDGVSGGTESTIKLGQKMGLEIINIAENYLQLEI